jgi:Flp pilus assembly pilin Flp
LTFVSMIINSFKALLPHDGERGQTLVEYALIIALVSVMLVAALTALQVGIGSAFSAIVTALNNAVGGGGGTT